MRLSDHEWMPAAERLCVGSTVKIKHSCGNSPSLSIRRSAATLSAHCYRCGAWGRKQLEHRPPRHLRGEETQQRSVPNSFIPLGDTAQHIQEAVYGFLANKGADPLMLRDCTLLYSADLDRVGFRQGDAVMARALHPDRHPKWVSYADMPHYIAGDDPTEVVLVEDILSACAVHYATKLTTIAVLGTTLKNATKTLLGASERAWVMLDGDAAGRGASVPMLKELRFMQIESRIVYTPEGCDPKDLSIDRLRNLLCTQPM